MKSEKQKVNSLKLKTIGKKNDLFNYRYSNFSLFTISF